MRENDRMRLVDPYALCTESSKNVRMISESDGGNVYDILHSTATPNLVMELRSGGSKEASIAAANVQAALDRFLRSGGSVYLEESFV